MPTGPEFVKGWPTVSGTSLVTDQQIARELRVEGEFTAPGTGNHNKQATLREMRNHIIASSIGSPKVAVEMARGFSALVSVGTTRIITSREPVDILTGLGLADSASPRHSTSTSEPFLDDEAPFRPGGSLGESLDWILNHIADWGDAAEEVMAETRIEVELQYAPTKRGCIRWGASDGTETLETVYLPAQPALQADGGAPLQEGGLRRLARIGHAEIMYTASAWWNSLYQMRKQHATASRAGRGASGSTTEPSATAPNATEADRAPPPPTSAESIEFTSPASPQSDAQEHGKGYSLSHQEGSAEMQGTTTHTKGVAHADLRPGGRGRRADHLRPDRPDSRAA